jgi:hypothetical protein
VFITHVKWQEHRVKKVVVVVVVVMVVVVVGANGRWGGEGVLGRRRTTQLQ